MASEWARKKAEEIIGHCDIFMLTSHVAARAVAADMVAAALDEARADGVREGRAAERAEQDAANALRLKVAGNFGLGLVEIERQGGADYARSLLKMQAEAEKRGAERERWECHQIASDFADRFGGTAGAVAIRIAARGPMRGPEGCSDGCGAASDEHCWNSSDWADGATPMRGPEEE